MSDELDQPSNLHFDLTNTSPTSSSVHTLPPSNSQPAALDQTAPTRVENNELPSLSIPFDTKNILMAQPRRSMSAALSMSDPNRELGVYLHQDLSDSTGVDSLLIAQGPDFKTAYSHLISHASQEIDTRPEWGATRQGMNDNTYEISTWNGEVVVRYSIELLRDIQSPESNIVVVGPAEHYGVFADIADSEERKLYFISGFRNLGEASHALKTSAQVRLAQHDSVRLMERSIELLDEKGIVKHRYVIVKGRFVRGRFERDNEDWSAMGLEFANDGARSDQENGPVGVRPLVEPQLARASTPQVPSALTPALTQVPELPAVVAPVIEAPHALGPAVETWCICHRPDDGTLMIACENDACPIQWYHGVCLGITEAPQGDWWCPTCAPAHAPKKGKKATGKGRKRKIHGR
jgi:hypothetical protein